jgi:alpha-L-arabinofuranosidase
MKSMKPYLAAWLCVICLTSAADEAGVTKNVRLETGRRGEPIHPFIYGQFIEHLGKCINEGIWAEMIEDRKFLRPVGTSSSRWGIVGPAANVTMSRDNAFVNGHVPWVRVAGQESGIFIGDVALLEGGRYTGRIWLAGDQQAGPVEVRLVWGDGPQDRSLVRIDELSSEYHKYPLEFAARTNTTRARFEIVGHGRGSFRIGPVSLMPADHVKGMRRDVLDLIRELNSPIYRWPGGTFATVYEWRDGLGDPDHRPTRENLAWGGLEPNDFGFHEFMGFCREVGTEPLVTVNTGLGDPYSAGEWVHYANDAATTPLGAWRASNGAPEPFRVKYWCIGNEMWNVWSWGFMEARYYVKKHNMTVDRMRAADPTILCVASTCFNYMQLRRDTQKEVSWNDLVVEQCLDRMEYMGEHFYSGAKTNVLEHVEQGAAQVRRIAEGFQALRDKYPILKQSAVRLAMTEWNVGHGPDVPECGAMANIYALQDGLLIAKGLHEYFRRSDVYFMANMAQTVNVLGAIKATKTVTWLEPVGLAMVMYRRHFGTVPLGVAGDFGPLDVKAALTADGKTLTLGVVNPTADPVSLDLEPKGLALAGEGRKHWFGGGTDPLIYNDPQNPRRIRLQERKVEADRPLMVEPYSATVFVVPLRQESVPAGH